MKIKSIRKFRVYADAGAYNINGCLITNGQGDGYHFVNLIETDDVFMSGETIKVEGFNALDGEVHIGQELFFGYKEFTLYPYDCENETDKATKVECEIFVVFVNRQEGKHNLTVLYK